MHFKTVTFSFIDLFNQFDIVHSIDGDYTLNHYHYYYYEPQIMQSMYANGAVTLSKKNRVVVKDKVKCVFEFSILLFQVRIVLYMAKKRLFIASALFYCYRYMYLQP